MWPITKYDNQVPKKPIVLSLDYYKILPPSQRHLFWEGEGEGVVWKGQVFDHQVNINFHMTKMCRPCYEQK